MFKNILHFSDYFLLHRSIQKVKHFKFQLKFINYDKVKFRTKISAKEGCEWGDIEVIKIFRLRNKMLNYYGFLEWFRTLLRNKKINLP